MVSQLLQKLLSLFFTPDLNYYVIVSVDFCIYLSAYVGASALIF